MHAFTQLTHELLGWQLSRAVATTISSELEDTLISRFGTLWRVGGSALRSIERHWPEIGSVIAFLLLMQRVTDVLHV